MTGIPKLRKTKLIATIGPACDDLDTLKAMIGAGMNVARLNMSHGTADSHLQTLQRIRQAAAEMGTTVAVMVDTKGREIRTGTMENGSVLLKRHQPFSIHCNEAPGNENAVSVTHPRLHEHAQPGDRILIDDGQIELIVNESSPQGIHCTVECGGVLKESKGVNLPDSKTAFNDMPGDDSQEIEFAASNDVQYLAASFIRNASDVVNIRNALKARGAEIPIIAKIENREGVENLNSIVKASNGIMVARGDLGVELELGEGPTIQKENHPGHGIPGQAGDNCDPDAGLNGAQPPTDPEPKSAMWPMPFLTAPRR